MKNRFCTAPREMKSGAARASKVRIAATIENMFEARVRDSTRQAVAVMSTPPS
jgi:hypothetical protein